MRGNSLYKEGGNMRGFVQLLEMSSVAVAECGCCVAGLVSVHVTYAD